MRVLDALPVRSSPLECHRGPTPGDATQARCARTCRSVEVRRRKALVRKVKIIFEKPVILFGGPVSVCARECRTRVSGEVDFEQYLEPRRPRVSDPGLN